MACEVPRNVDPEAYGRGVLAQIERDIRRGRRLPDNRPRIFYASTSYGYAGCPPQIIIEDDAKTAVINFDVRKMEFYGVGDHLPLDAVEIRVPDHGPGRLVCLTSDLWRMVDDPAGISGTESIPDLIATNERTTEQRTISAVQRRRFTYSDLDEMYVHEIALALEPSSTH
jgi:hypothetical protein